MPLLKDSRILSDFREMPFYETFAKSRRSGGNPLKAAMMTDSVLSAISAKLSKASALETLSKNWNMCIDAKFVGKTFVYNVKGNIAFVSATNAQIKQSIAFSEKKILSKITQLEGCENISKIRFV